MSDPMPETRERVTVLWCRTCREPALVADAKCSGCDGDDFESALATLTGRDALVMDWARKIIAYTKAVSAQPPTGLETWEYLKAEHVAAWKALSAFDAAQEGE